MKFSFVKYVVLVGLALAACSKPTTVEKLDDGIIVRISGKEARSIRLRVVAENIIQVAATPLDTFSTVKSLMVVPGVKSSTPWSLEEKADEVSIVTATLRATVSSVGEVRFTDLEGNVWLQEQAGGGKTFQALPAAKQGYAIRQVFESPAEEAFYGLGGHQNGQMNYKNQDVDLVQHNIVDVVPFLYSSKNYGLLWDNYSISKFGDPREYESLTSLTLYDKDGKAGGLTASYFVKDKVIKQSIDNEINYEFLETPQVDNFPKDVSREGKVVWEGSFSSKNAGVHKFLVYASGYFKVWVDGKLLMDKWRQNWNPWINKFTLVCEANEKHTLKLEWTPDDNGFFAVKHLDPISVEEQGRLSFSSEIADEINYYFIAGKNADEVIKGYRFLTGKAPLMPLWALGFWQSRERYTNQKDLIEVVKEYRKRNIPIDNIVLDWQYWEDPKWGSHEFDLKRFPDPQGMVEQLHNELHTQLMISVWPKFNKGVSNYEEMNKHGFLFTRNIEKKRKDWVGTGYESTFYDPFNEEAGKLFWKQIDKNLNAIGIDGWWLDATEPDMHSNISIEERKNNMSPTAMGPGEKYFNAYSLMNSKSVYEGQRKSSPDKRVFILTRSAYAGQQRYGAVTWSGDVVARWSDLKDQVAAGINFSLSGIPYWTMDIGGFAVEKRFYTATGETLAEWRELNTRWFQFGAFCPVFRSHGQYPFREIYNIAEQGSAEYESMVYYTKLRYRLLPYIYSLVGKTYLDDYTLLRGLAMDFNHDANIHNIADQYMFGPSLLINPVSDFKARQRSVYLPATNAWYDFYTGNFLEGGQNITANAPLERMPVYVKAGSIIPAGPELQYTSEKKTDPLTLYVFTGQDAAFTLYEDEGTNYNYEQGKFSTVEITYTEATAELTFGKRQGEFVGMTPQREVLIVWVKKDRPVGVGLAALPDQVIRYTGNELKVKQDLKR